MLSSPRRPHRPEGDDSRLWLWKLAASTARTLMAVGRFLLWWWREGNDTSVR